jgi:hypothetical protein
LSTSGFRCAPILSFINRQYARLIYLAPAREQYVCTNNLSKELAMLTALVLICSTAVTPDLRDCTRDNATAVMRLPAQSGNPATCFMHGQAFLAQSSIGQELGDNERVKIICARSETVDAVVRRTE